MSSTSMPADEVRDPVEALAEDFIDRHRRGERPNVSEYVAAHPDLASAIHKLFPMLLMLEGSILRSPPPTMPPAATSTPQHLGEFRILRVVGRGGMGVVYEAEQASLGRRVALKVLSGSRQDPLFLERFRREAQAAARLHHTNIVPVHGVGEVDGLHYIVMQYIAGISLDQAVSALQAPRTTNEPTQHRSPERTSTRTAALAPNATPAPLQNRHRDGPPIHDAAAMVAHFRRVAAWGVQVAQALAHAHQHGVYHRDIKPSNLLLDEDDRVWVTDFGLARVAGDPKLTEAGYVVGTLRYMPPERFHQEEHPTGDVYSLGATLYELLTLRAAFVEEQRDALIFAVRSREPLPPRKLIPALPRDLETIILKAMAKEPKRRYTAAGLAEDLQRFLDHRPLRARRAGPVERFARWSRRNPAIAALVVGLFLSLSLGLGVALMLWHRAEGHREHAEANLAAAQREYQRAEANLRAVKEQRDATQREFERAEANLRAAFRAVDESFTKISESQLLNVPGLQPLRQELLTSALRYYQAFLQQKRGDSRLLREVARACYRAGNLYYALGPREKALETFQEGLRICEAQRTAQGDAPELIELEASCYLGLGLAHSAVSDTSKSISSYLAAVERLGTLEAAGDAAVSYSRLWPLLARAHINVAEMYRLQSRPNDGHQALVAAMACLDRVGAADRSTYRYLDERVRATSALARVCLDRRELAQAEALLTEGLRTSDSLVKANPTVPTFRRELARLWNTMATLHLMRDDLEPAQHALEQARPLLAELTTQNPHVIDYQRGLATALTQLAHLQRLRGQDEAALATDRQNLAVLEPIVERNPTDARTLVNLVVTEYHVGRDLCLRDDLLEALPVACRGFEHAQFLVARDPRQPRHLSLLGAMWNLQGMLHYRRGELTEAREAFEEAIRHQELALQATPEAARVLREDASRHLTEHRVNLAILHATQRNNEALQAEHARILELVPSRDAAATHVELATHYTHLIVGAASDAGKREWADRAIHHLRSALELGYQSSTRLEVDARFAILADVPEFKQLIADYPPDRD
jgi:serine/threonine protein kinase/tetratricopeptide (TPR) repeat protein